MSELPRARLLLTMITRSAWPADWSTPARPPHPLFRPPMIAEVSRACFSSLPPTSVARVPLRSTFDDSREASLARRYEADADRGFYKALKEFRRVEAEVPSRIEAAPDDPIASPPESRMGSFREAASPVDRERALDFLDELMVENPVVRGADGRPLSITRPLPPSV